MRALIADVVFSAGSAGVHRIEVTANPAALAFYRAVGFVQHASVQTALRQDAPRMHLLVG